MHAAFQLRSRFRPFRVASFELSDDDEQGCSGSPAIRPSAPEPRFAFRLLLGMSCSPVRYAALSPCMLRAPLPGDGGTEDHGFDFGKITASGGR